MPAAERKGPEYGPRWSLDRGRGARPRPRVAVAIPPRGLQPGREHCDRHATPAPESWLSCPWQKSQPPDVRRGNDAKYHVDSLWQRPP